MTVQNCTSFYASIWRTSLTPHTLMKVALIFPYGFTEKNSEFRKLEIHFPASLA